MTVNAHPASQRGVDELDLPFQLRVMRLGFRLLRLVSRRAAGRLVLHLFVTPRRHAPPEREREALAGAEAFSLEHRGRRLACWRWPARGGARRGTAILVHGWEGRGGQLHHFAPGLAADGFDVVTFDHVGHGASDGRRCSLPAMRDALRAVADATAGGAAQDAASGPAAIVAHSMGSFASSLLLAEGWRGTRVCYVSPPDDLLVYFSRYLRLVTGSDDLLPDLIDRMERRFGERAEGFEFRRLVETLDQPLLVVHSTDDTDVPVEAGRFVAGHWPGARLMEVVGLGHRRILRDGRVVEAARAFLAE
jgi:pimeloyl-ACP methyl ester carboxylesterase